MTASLSREAMDAAKEAFKNAAAYDYCDPDKPDPLESAITAYLSATGWRTIDSARTDGTRYWLYYPEAHPDDRQVAGHFHGERWVDNADAHEFIRPTHYRDLPAPPSPTGKEE